jgi:hypothetical protein
MRYRPWASLPTPLLDLNGSILREALRGRTPTVKQREHHEGKGIGIVDAIAVPIHYPGGDPGPVR